MAHPWAVAGKVAAVTLAPVEVAAAIDATTGAATVESMPSPRARGH